MSRFPKINMPLTVARGLMTHAGARLHSENVWSVVTYLVTLRCDLRCAYCDFPRHADGELTTPQAKRLLRGLRRGGTFRMAISGGEPLLREDLGEIIRTSVDCGFITSVVTNAVRLCDRVDELLPAHYVLTTIEGDEATHDRSRGKSTFAKAMAGMEAVRKRGGPKLGVVCPVHVGNVGAIEGTLLAAEEMGGRAFYQRVQIRDGWAGPEFGEVLEWDRVSAAFERILAWKREGRPVGNSSSYLKLMIGPSAPKIREVCPAGRYVVTVLPDGSVVPCCMVPFDRGVPVEDLDRPATTRGELTTPSCEHCTISPYLENYLLLKPDISAVVEALTW